MKNYIVTYHAPMDFMKQSQESSPEEMKKGMEAWMAWAQKCGDKLVDMGNPLVNGLKLRADRKSEDSKREVCGYSILKANNIEDAKELLKGHPHLAWNSACEIEVHETMPVPGS